MQDKDNTQKKSPAKLSDEARSLFAESGLPLRHRQNYSSVDRSGPWADKLSSIVARIGTGTLCAICGRRGTGKTQMALDLVIANANADRSSKYITAPELFMALKATFAQGSNVAHQPAPASGDRLHGLVGTLNQKGGEV